MDSLAQARVSRFELVNAGHRFLIEGLPPQRPNSDLALTTFEAAIRRIDPLPADLDVVLLRCLTVLSRHLSGRIPSLVDMYLSAPHTSADRLTRFMTCVRDRLRYQGIRDGAVQDALQCVTNSYANSSCTPMSVAAGVGRRLQTLDVAFKRETGSTLTEHIRDVRLERASVILATTNKSIKEVWAEVGYNHHSTFDHDFKTHFGSSPRQYRARTLRPVARTFFDERYRVRNGNDSLRTSTQANVLIVDDDEISRTTIATWLQSDGHLVAVACSGTEALAQAHRLSPAAILLDYHLGDMDGLSCLRALRQNSPVTKAAVAIFTADLDVLERADEVAELDAMVASKLCDLERVSDLVVFLTSHVQARHELENRGAPWKDWVSFL